MFIVRTPLSFLFGLAARKGAEKVTHAALKRTTGGQEGEAPDPNDLSVELRYALLAALVEGAVYAIAKVLAARGTDRVAGVLTGRSERPQA